MLVIPTVILILTAALMWLRLTTPFDGVRLVPGEWVFRSDGVEVAPLDEQTNGVTWGNLVVAVEGRDLSSWAQSLLQPSAQSPNWQSVIS